MRCLRSYDAVTPAKYGCDIYVYIQWVTSVLIMLDNEGNNGTEKIGLETQHVSSSLSNGHQMNYHITFFES